MLNKLIASIILVFVLSGVLIGCDKGTAERGNGDLPAGDESKHPSNDGTEGGGSENGGTENGGTESGGTENGGTEIGGGSTEDNNDSADGGDNTGGNEEDNPPTLTIGSEVGNLCPALDLERVGGGTVNIENYRGKVVVVNIWGTWCPPCKEELPDFDRIASEYDDVVIIAAHSNGHRENAEVYVNTNFPDSKIVFAYDTANDDYWSAIGGVRYYPRTVVLDKNGVITYGVDGALSYESLKYLVENAGAGN